MSEEQKAALQRDYIRKNHPHWFPFGGSQCAVCMLMEEQETEIKRMSSELIMLRDEILSKARTLKPEPVTDLPKPKKKRAKK